MLRLKFAPGAVSAFNFIVLDLVILTVLDVVLSRCVCKLYYRKIDAGEPISVRSADVPGVTTFLIGPPWSIPNIVAIFIKLSFLACILVIDLNIRSEVNYRYYTTTTTGLFTFDPSDDTWGIVNNDMTEDSYVFHRVVSRRWEQVRSCREQDGDALDYYALVFNLDNGVIVEDETRDPESTERIYVNDSTLQCTSPSRLREAAQSVRIARVVGCSQHFGDTPCTDSTIKTISHAFPPDHFVVGNSDIDRTMLVSLPEGVSNSILSYIEYSEDFSKRVFQNHTDPKLACVETRIGPSAESHKPFTTCLLSATVDGNNTLMERWSLEKDMKTGIGILRRAFPGPIFEGLKRMGIFLTSFTLQNPVLEPNWITMSSIVVADSVVHQNTKLTLEYKEQDGTVTTLPMFSIVIALAMLAVAFIARFVVHFTIGKDQRPQINTINGLSSVAQNEKNPQGRGLAMNDANYVTLGLSMKGNRPHFGPLLASDASMQKRTSSSPA